VNWVSFSPDNKLIASASQDQTVKLWNRNGNLITTLHGHKDAVFAVNFSPDGKLLASASKNATVILWNLDLDDLITRGCGWLHDYLKTHRNANQLEVKAIIRVHLPLCYSSSQWLHQERLVSVITKIPLWISGVENTVVVMSDAAS
jgi:WD40 repeat protein